MSGIKIINLEEYRKSKEPVWGLGIIETNDSYKRAQNIFNIMCESVLHKMLNSLRVLK